MMKLSRLKLVAAVSVSLLLTACAVSRPKVAEPSEPANPTASTGFDENLQRRFESEYPGAAAKIEQAYRQVKITGTQTRTKLSQRTSRIEALELLRDGERIRQK